MRVALAYSGGLDTSYCLAWLTETIGAEVVTVTVDTGGFDDAEREAIARRARALGAVRHVAIDARRDVFDRFVATLIRGNVLRGEVYPLSVAAERVQQAIAVVRAARAEGADALAHGATGAGNDQVRFDVAWRALAPELPILAPIREHGVTREKALGWLAERGFEPPAAAGRYSVNSGLWGTTLGGGWTHDPWAAPPDDAWTEAGVPEPIDDPVDVEIEFEQGLPVGIAGRARSGPDAIEALSRLTRPRGIGRGIHIGETVLGIKGRIGFEAGAALVLIAAHRELEKIVLSRWQAFWKDHLARFWGDQLHEGRFFDPCLRDIEAMIASSQRFVTGRARVHLARERFTVTGVRSPHTLLDPEVARYGEENALWSGADAAGFGAIAAVGSRLALARARRAGEDLP